MEADEWEELEELEASSQVDGMDWKIDYEERARARAMVRSRSRRYNDRIRHRKTRSGF